MWANAGCLVIVRRNVVFALTIFRDVSFVSLSATNDRFFDLS
jgi:hypothetical protein